MMLENETLVMKVPVMGDANPMAIVKRDAEYVVHYGFDDSNGKGYMTRAGFETASDALRFIWRVHPEVRPFEVKEMK